MYFFTQNEIYWVHRKTKEIQTAIQKEAATMKERNINRVWAVSLLITGICTIMLGLAGMAADNRDILMRISGVTELMTLPVLMFTTVLKIKKEN